MSCDKPLPPDGENNGIDTNTIVTVTENENDTNVSLQGTKWKLAGIFDAKTDTLIKELELKDCGVCYTFIFDDTDSIYFRTILNNYGGTYEVDYEVSKIRIIEIWGTMIGEMHEDVQLYYGILNEFRKT
jgi:hypothetical protein